MWLYYHYFVTCLLMVIAATDSLSANDAGTITKTSTASINSGSASDSATITSAASSPTGTGSISNKHGGASNTHSSAVPSISIDPRSPAGAVVIVTPAVASGVSYYRIGQQITFAWNYTNLIVTPTQIVVQAYCSMNKAQYTIAANMSAAKTTVVWDTSAYQANATVPLLTASYTLMIYDAVSGSTAAPKPGYLAAFSGLSFGMYSSQPYAPLDQFTCATCNVKGLASAKYLGLWFIAIGVIFAIGYGWGIAGERRTLTLTSYANTEWRGRMGCPNREEWLCTATFEATRVFFGKRRLAAMQSRAVPRVFCGCEKAGGSIRYKNMPNNITTMTAIFARPFCRLTIPTVRAFSRALPRRAAYDSGDYADYESGSSSTGSSSTTAPASATTRLNDAPLVLQEGDPTKVDWARSFHGLSTEAFPEDAVRTLTAPIDIDDIEIKPGATCAFAPINGCLDGVVYLPEIKYRRILNKAFSPGGWGLAPRGETSVTGKQVSREYALVCNGRLVSVARGEQDYFDTNGIATATEGCKSNALMRCCKDLGIASELWDPRFVRKFKKEHCAEQFAEHVVSKKKRKLWRRREDQFEYPYKAATF
ncbi:Mitochondrial genome maintenance protein mgm101 [Neolecta irregularis DAH-3]|uniref:Mitochondrial genome maintenance protein MGM101 n=1 Tax=Neolecta irregularis (strain DAH-3) TaxID=1198029 RepID=A0A1U7LG61_NEOID|nr:Mitochondrial genome maintenance protein mgm101 [Neolecta irregularis DAH-3]|eukprot:OLL21644.1 Mitochondrial genome maintenance protein mgm101 [Neolecta irregularis DAH-3]